MEVRKIAYVIPVSTALLDDARDLRSDITRWQQMSPAEQYARVQEMKAERARERTAAQIEDPSLYSLIAKLGWSEAYARHFVQPYCYCGDGSDGWEYCEHARDEGLEREESP